MHQREEAIRLLNQAESEEKELLMLENQAKQIALGRIESVRDLKIVAQQRVDVEMLAAQGIEIQLKAEKEALDAENSRVEIVALATQAANTRAAQDNQYAEQAAQSLQADQIAAQEFDHKLALINNRIELSEQRARLLIEECLAEESKLALDTAVMKADRERVEAEKMAMEALNKRLILDAELTQAASLRLQTENQAISEISLRMETELKAIEADNARIVLEVAAREILEAQLLTTEEVVAKAKVKEEIEIRSLRMSKLRADSEAQAAQAESEVLQAHDYANQLAQERIVTAQNLQQYIDERVRDELFYLELEQKKCAAEMLERDSAKARMEAEQRYLEEVEKRISAEIKATLVTNQRQIAEQLVQYAALDKWKTEKQTVLSLNTKTDFNPGVAALLMENNSVGQIGRAHV